MDEEHKKILKILYESYNNHPRYQVDSKDLKENQISFTNFNGI